MLSSSVLVMGRHTYDVMAPVWPTMSGNPLAEQDERDAQARRVRNADRARLHVIEPMDVVTATALMDAARFIVPRVIATIPGVRRRGWGIRAGHQIYDI